MRATTGCYFDDSLNYGHTQINTHPEFLHNARCELCVCATSRASWNCPHIQCAGVDNFNSPIVSFLLVHTSQPQPLPLVKRPSSRAWGDCRRLRCCGFRMRRRTVLSATLLVMLLYIRHAPSAVASRTNDRRWGKSGVFWLYI